MTNDLMQRALRELAGLLDHEARDIRLRNFERIAALLRRKEALVGICEEFLAKSAFGPEQKALLEEFAAVRAKAEQNAAQLVSIRQGFSDAKARLEALHQADQKTGLYGAQGREIRDRSPGSVARQV